MSVGVPQKRDSRSLLCVITCSDAAETDAPAAGDTTHTLHRTTTAANDRYTESMNRTAYPWMPPGATAARLRRDPVHEALRPGWGSLPRDGTSTHRVHGDAFDGPAFAGLAHQEESMSKIFCL